MTVSTLVGCDWTVVNTNSWITLTSGTNNLGTTNVTYTLAANRNLGHRTGGLTIADMFVYNRLLFSWPALALLLVARNILLGALAWRLLRRSVERMRASEPAELVAS